jgi:hypothetical protein
VLTTSAVAGTPKTVATDASGSSSTASATPIETVTTGPAAKPGEQRKLETAAAESNATKAEETSSPAEQKETKQ